MPASEPNEPTTRRGVASADAPAPVAAYGQGIVGAGLVFTAGQAGIDRATGGLAEGIEAQTRCALENVEAILVAGGASLASALKVSVFIADRADYRAMNEVYRTYMPDPPPVRTTVQAGLGAGMLVEIDVIALAGG